MQPTPSPCRGRGAPRACPAACQERAGAYPVSHPACPRAVPRPVAPILLASRHPPSSWSRPSPLRGPVPWRRGAWRPRPLAGPRPSSLHPAPDRHRVGAPGRPGKPPASCRAHRPRPRGDAGRPGVPRTCGRRWRPGAGPAPAHCGPRTALPATVAPRRGDLHPVGTGRRAWRCPCWWCRRCGPRVRVPPRHWAPQGRAGVRLAPPLVPRRPGAHPRPDGNWAARPEAPPG